MKKMLIVGFVLVLAMTNFAFAAGAQEAPLAAAQGVTPTSVLVGNAAATSGFFATVGGPFNDGIQAYFKRINDACGVNGRMIDFVHYDDEFNASKGIAATERLVEDDKVFALVGHFGTPTVGATLGYIRETGIPMVYAATGIGDLFRDKAVDGERAVFPVQPIYQTEGRWMVAKALEMFPQAKKIGVFYTNDDAGQNLLWGVENYAKQAGVQVVVRQTALSEGNISPAAQVTAIKSEGVDVVIAAMNQGPFLTLVGELSSQNMTAPVFTSYVSSNITVANALYGANGIVGKKFDTYAGAWVNLSGERAKNYEAFVADMTAFGKAELGVNAYAMAGWIAGNFFVEGLKRVQGVLTWDAYINALESAPISNPLGGVIDYSDGKRWGTQEMALLKADMTSALGWSEALPISGIVLK